MRCPFGWHADRTPLSRGSKSAKCPKWKMGRKSREMGRKGGKSIAKKEGKREKEWQKKESFCPMKGKRRSTEFEKPTY